MVDIDIKCASCEKVTKNLLSNGLCIKCDKEIYGGEHDND